ncbi:MAG TPA: protein O-GlcNAcase [Trueperaceae bacterium]|nr:protein O-GlcNAcase [Trueperaceae bacterium]
MGAFEVQGVVEGFYGAAYTQAEREDMLRFLGAHGYDTYYYGPKNDRQHRARWREHYGDQALADFASSVRVASHAGIDFVYTLSPGLDVRYSSDEDSFAIREKLTSLMRVGVRSFGLFLDDINPTFRHRDDGKVFGSFAHAQAQLCNEVLDWLKQERTDASLVMCPTAYHGAPPFGDYLHELGERLSPEIDVFYTGTEVCSTTIGAHEVDEFSRALGRKPLIWDNYPVNDGGMSSELHVEPIRGRAPELAGKVKGFAVNPMNQAEASKVTLHTFAAYFADPVGYDADAEWSAAIAAVAGAEHAGAFEAFARTCRHGVLVSEPAPELARLSADALAELRARIDRRSRSQGARDGTGQPAARPALAQPAIRRLLDHVGTLDEACYALKFHLRNYALRAEILPWVEALESWLWAGRRAMELVVASEAGEDVPRAVQRLEEPYRTARAHHKRSGGSELQPLIELALKAYAGVPA